MPIAQESRTRVEVRAVGVLDVPAAVASFAATGSVYGSRWKRSGVERGRDVVTSTEVLLLPCWGHGGNCGSVIVKETWRANARY